MPKNDTQIGRLAGERVDRAIYLSKAFVQIWRVSPALERIQYLDFLAGRAVCPEKFVAIHERLVFLQLFSCSDRFDFVATAHLLGSSPGDYRRLQRDRASSFNAVSGADAESRVCAAC